MRKMRKIPEKKWIGGVCAGIAYGLGLPAWGVRLLLTLSVLGLGFGVLLYVLLWIFMPAWDATPADYDEVAGG
ncbi:MAG TPA: PspC domain-containing protein [Candidatus Methanoperedens sp.]|nr:PspC domain-containing protein [Candidatus Methanoperedens sp.]